MSDNSEVNRAAPRRMPPEALARVKAKLAEHNLRRQEIVPTHVIVMVDNEEREIVELGMPKTIHLSLEDGDTFIRFSVPDREGLLPIGSNDVTWNSIGLSPNVSYEMDTVSFKGHSFQCSIIYRSDDESFPDFDRAEVTIKYFCIQNAGKKSVKDFVREQDRRRAKLNPHDVEEVIIEFIGADRKEAISTAKSVQQRFADVGTGSFYAGLRVDDGKGLIPLVLFRGRCEGDEEIGAPHEVITYRWKGFRFKVSAIYTTPDANGLVELDSSIDVVVDFWRSEMVLAFWRIVKMLGG